MIGRYGGCFEEGIWWVYDTGERCAVLEGLAMVEGWEKVHIIHGLNISHKELIYLLQKSTSHQNQALHACSQGDRLVGKDHRSSPTATHKERNQRTPHASNLSHNGYHTCILRDLKTSTQVSLQFTTTHQHDSNITIFISQNYCKESNISYSVIYKFMQDFMTNHVN